MRCVAATKRKKVAESREKPNGASIINTRLLSAPGAQSAAGPSRADLPAAVLIELATSPRAGFASMLATVPIRSNPITIEAPRPLRRRMGADFVIGYSPETPIASCPGARPIRLRDHLRRAVCVCLLDRSGSSLKPPGGRPRNPSWFMLAACAWDLLSVRWIQFIRERRA